MKNPVTVDSSDFHYLDLREAIGWIGFVMPIVVWSIGWLQGLDSSVFDSVSAHYYSQARDIFVGSMALIGILIYFYQSPHEIDNVIARITGVAGVLIGILPMTHKPAMGANNMYTLIQNLHLYPVAIFFLGGIYLVLISFRKTTVTQLYETTSPDNETVQQLESIGYKERRNYIYVICGIFMILGGLVLVLANSLEPYFDWWRGWRYVPETVMIMAFAFAWLVKGQTFSWIRD